MPLSRRALLTEGSRAVAVAGTAVVGLLGTRTARPASASKSPPIDTTISAPTAIDELLLVPEEDRVVAFSRRCTHLGCQLNVAEDELGFVCPCHGSRFDLHGHRVEGPATRNLSIVATVPR